MFVLPGDILTSTVPGSCLGGVGTYVSSTGVLRASLSGERVEEGGVVSVRHSQQSRTTLVPEVGQLVLARVLRISPLMTHCELLLCEGKPTAPYSGVVRREYVREGEVDTVRMEECFLPGDIIQAVVASLGDARSFLLTTTQLHCGVVSAKAQVSGGNLVAVSSTEMECTQSGAREKRKVAKITAAS